MHENQDNPQRHSRIVARFFQLIVAIALMAGLWTYGTARNRGMISRRWESLFFVAWVSGMVLVWLIYSGMQRRRAFGESEKATFSFEQGEEPLFDENLIAVEFYPDAVDVPQHATIWEWIRQQEFSYRSRMRVTLTNRRIVLGTVFGRQQHSIPLSNIKSFTKVPGPWPFKSFILRFQHGEKQEALRLGYDHRSQNFIEALTAITNGRLL